MDLYGAGTAVVTGSGAPTAGFVYKLVEVDGRPVAKRSEHKASHGGGKVALRAHRPSGTAIEEMGAERHARRVRGAGRASCSSPTRTCAGSTARSSAAANGPPTGTNRSRVARQRLHDVLGTLPWEGLSLSRGEPVLEVRRP